MKRRDWWEGVPRGKDGKEDDIKNCIRYVQYGNVFVFLCGQSLFVRDHNQDPAGKRSSRDKTVKEEQGKKMRLLKQKKKNHADGGERGREKKN